MLGQAVGSSESSSPRPPHRAEATRYGWTAASGNATLAPHSLLACVGYGCGSRCQAKCRRRTRLLRARTVVLPQMAAVGQRRRTPGSPQGRTSSVDPKRIRLEGRPAGRPSRRTYVPSTFTDQPGPRPLNAEPRPHRRIEAFPDRRSQRVHTDG